jgi:predicted RNA-binding Zn-ribbon protein involved in translation (DUF1610 family)
MGTESTKKKKQKRVENHCCIKCNTPLPDGYTKKTCPDCLKIMSEKNKVQYKRRMGNGLSEERKAKRQELKAQHRCTKCGSPLPDDYNHILCSKCLEKEKVIRDENGKTAHKPRRPEFCIVCGQPIARKSTLGSKRYCPSCYKEHRLQYDREIYHKKHQRCLKEHLCTICGSPLPDGYEKRICMSCNEKIHIENKLKRVKIQKDGESDL